MHLAKLNLIGFQGILIAMLSVVNLSGVGAMPPTEIAQTCTNQQRGSSANCPLPLTFSKGLTNCHRKS